MNHDIIKAVKAELNTLYMSSYAIAEEMTGLSARLKVNNQLKEATIDLFLKKANQSLEADGLQIAIVSRLKPLPETDPDYPLNHYHTELLLNGRVIVSEDCGISFMPEKRYEMIVEYLKKAEAFTSTLKTLNRIEKLIEFKSELGGCKS